MPTGVKSFLFLLLIPFLMGVGHDVYLNYFSDDIKIKQAKRLQIDPNDFLVSDAGWTWNNYHPQSMNIARDMVEPETWKEKVDPVLKLPTMIISIAPLVVGAIFFLITFALGIWPFNRQGRSLLSGKSDFVVYKHAKEKAVKYKKK